MRLMSDIEWSSRLEDFLSEKVGAAVTLTAARQLTGGASRETWAIDIDTEGQRQALVLRRDMGGEIQPEEEDVT